MWILFVATLSSFSLYAENIGVSESTDFSAAKRQPVTEYNVKNFGLNARCEKFIKPDGSLGEWGNFVVKAIERVGTECFYDRIDFRAICPGYANWSKKFSADETKKMKQRFLAFFFAAISGMDQVHSQGPGSGCDTKFDSSAREAKAPHFVGGGLMFLEKRDAIRRKNRDPVHCMSEKSFEDPEFQIRCAASMFNQIHCGEKQRDFSKGYYLIMRRPEFAKTVRRFPGCTNAK